MQKERNSKSNLKTFYSKQTNILLWKQKVRVEISIPSINYLLIYLFDFICKRALQKIKRLWTNITHLLLKEKKNKKILV